MTLELSLRLKLGNVIVMEKKTKHSHIRSKLQELKNNTRFGVTLTSQKPRGRGEKRRGQRLGSYQAKCQLKGSEREMTGPEPILPCLVLSSVIRE